ncbi:MAG: hypothetical protein DWQ06_08840 [Calditrichaeota bacterium]|nr:MAG: hypothetical protein DWQ06_08840 [Calditrichota bacterium]
MILNPPNFLNFSLKILLLFCFVSVFAMESFAQSETLKKDLKKVLESELPFQKRVANLKSLLLKYEGKDKSTIYQLLGQFMEQVDSTETIKNYEAALALEPEDPRISFQLGSYLLLLSDQGKHQKALKLLRSAEDKVKTLNPRDELLEGYIADGLGWAFALNGNLDLAEEKLKSSIKIFEKYSLPTVSPISHLLETYALGNNYEEAFDLILGLYAETKGLSPQIRQDLKVAYKGFNNGNLEGFDRRVAEGLKAAEEDYKLVVEQNGGEIISFETNDYHKIEGILYKAKVPNSPVVVFVHPFGDSQKSLTSVAKSFVKAGINVFTLDLRGHGRSVSKQIPVPDALQAPANSVDFHNITFDIKKAISVLKKIQGIDASRIAVIGIDEGASIGRIATKFKDEVKAFVLISPLQTYRYSDLRKAIKLAKTPKPTLFVTSNVDSESLDLVDELIEISDKSLTEKNVFDSPQVGIRLLKSEKVVSDFVINWVKSKL